MEISVVLCRLVGRTAGLLQTVVGDTWSAAVFVLHVLVDELGLQRDAVDPQAM